MGYLNNIRLLWADAWGLDIFLLRWNFLCNGIGYNGIWSPFVSLTHSPSGGFDSLVPFATVNPAVSEEPNMSQICDPMLSNGVLLVNPRSLWCTKHSFIIDGLTQSAFPRCLWPYLADLPLNLPGLFRYNLCLSHIIDEQQLCSGGFWVFAPGWRDSHICLGGVTGFEQRHTSSIHLATAFGIS